MLATTRFLVILIMILCHFNGTALSIWTDALLFLSIVLFSSLAVAIFLKNNFSLKYSTPELLLLLFIAYLLITNGIRGSFFDNERLLTYITFLMLYFPLSLVYKKDKGLLRYLLYGILITTSLEVVVGFGQIFDFIPNPQSQFVLGGLFGNPGAYGGHLSIVFAIILVMVLYRKELRISENIYYASFTCLLSIAFLLIMSDSRGAWIAAFSGLALILNLKFSIISSATSLLKSKALKYVSGIVLICVIALLSFALYQYKPASAFGRLFVWKVSKGMVLENPILGNGYGYFEASYGKTQAQYFINNNAVSNEIEVADYVTCAYNEFLEMYIESGLVGLILFLGILFFAFVAQSKPNNLKIHIAAKASLISMIVLSMVSYPFKIMPNQIILLSSLFIIFNTASYKSYYVHRFSKAVVFLFLSIILSLSFLFGKYLYGTYHFRNGYAKVIQGDINSGLKDYAIAFKQLQNNGKFLFYYGAAFYLKQDYEQSVDFLIKATELTSNPNAFITLGNSFKELERYEEAEQAYKTASGITPAKLYPRYLLVLLYIEMQETDNAIIMANYIIKAEEKNPTTAGRQIKEEMQILVDQYSKPDVLPLKQKTMSP